MEDAVAKGARLEDALSEEFLGQGVKGEIGMLAASVWSRPGRSPESGCVGRGRWKIVALVHRAERDPSRSRRLVTLVTPKESYLEGGDQLAGDGG